MPAALFISPHLDDVAFSCPEVLLALRENGWDVIVATVFTASVPAPTGFALACQRDKGLADEVDYMALRRAEDRAFAARLGIDCRHLDLPEAPHRGYEDARALFATLRDRDPARRTVPPVLHGLLEVAPWDLCVSPVGIGGHVDHAVVVAALDAVLATRPGPASLRFVDQPYGLRHPADARSALRGAKRIHCASVPRRRRVAIDAVSEYVTQIGFQFGSAENLRGTLDALFAQGTTLLHDRGVVDLPEDFTVLDPMPPVSCRPGAVPSATVD